MAENTSTQEPRSTGKRRALIVTYECHGCLQRAAAPLTEKGVFH